MTKHSTFLDAIKIYEKLETVLKRTGPDACEYINPAITDGEIAKQLAVTKSSVAHVRLGRFGHLAGTNVANSNGQRRAVIERLDDHEKRITHTEQHGETLLSMLVEAQRQHNELNEIVSKLMREISLNKVLDVRHLDPLVARKPVPVPQPNGQQQATRR